MKTIEPTVLVRSGKTILNKRIAAQMKLQDATIVDRFEAHLTKNSLDVIAVKNKLFRKDRYDYSFPLAESQIDRLDESRSAGKAATGALVGGLLAGTLGLVVGGLLGGTKTYTFIIRNGDSSLIFEVTKSGLQQLSLARLLRE